MIAYIEGTTSEGVATALMVGVPVAFGLLTAFVAGRRGRDRFWWFLGGLALGPAGLFAVLWLAPKSRVARGADRD